jgi:predicted acetyltransferase
LGSGVHIHKDYRKSNGVEGVFKLLLDKLLQEKGSKTMVISFAHPKAMDMYRSVGFKDINEKELPEEILSEIQEAESRGSVGALQKLKLNQWWMTIKRNSNFLIYRRD